MAKGRRTTSLWELRRGKTSRGLRPQLARQFSLGQIWGPGPTQRTNRERWRGPSLWLARLARIRTSWSRYNEHGRTRTGLWLRLARGGDGSRVQVRCPDRTGS